MTIRISENQWLDPHFPSALVTKIGGQRIIFGSAYQWYLYHKSRDKHFREQVLMTINLNDLEQIDRQHKTHIKGWRKRRLKLMIRANTLKFKQHPTLRRLLMDTELDYFEADLKFGWGKDARYWCQKFDRKSTKDGKNKLSEVLVRVRSKFKHRQEHDARTREEEE